MKRARLEQVALLLTIMFFVFTAGYFIGQNNVDSGFQVSIERSGSSPSPGAMPTASGANQSPSPGVDPIQEKININTADLTALQSLPGIGAARASQIIAYRDQNGPFKRIENITEVSGIGEKIFDAIADLITVD